MTDTGPGFTPNILQQNGFVHGGVVSYAADNALTYAGGTALDWAVVTSEIKINSVRPAVGERLGTCHVVIYIAVSKIVVRHIFFGECFFCVRRIANDKANKSVSRL